ncbi:MAG: nucleoside triphosphate pyrophosphohydrolase [Chloroflexota bacterium]
MSIQVQGLLDELRARFDVSVSDGLQFLTASGLARRPFDPGMAIVLLPDDSMDASGRSADEDFRPSALPGRAAHGGGTSDMLGALYPRDHPVHGLAGAADLTVGEVTDAAFDSHAHYIPALAPLSNPQSPHTLPWLVARLRAPDGCPWDREQDHLSLRKFLLEETYEVYDALEKGSTPALAEELGDLLLQIVLHAEYAAEDGVFDLTDVYRNVVTKIVRRHPHVFGDVVADSAAEVIRNWEQIKAGERAERSAQATETDDGNKSVPAAFAGLSRSLPALAYAQEMQERAASLGYDWPSIEGVLEKVTEEAAEVVAARDDGERHEEFGDLLMVLVNLARKLGIDSEAALRAASAKFAARFANVERQAAERDVELRALSMDELDELWQQAKLETANREIVASAGKR